ncbi:MAG: hypothetical protein ACO1N0_16140 [Fluviicola sp.]
MNPVKITLSCLVCTLLMAFQSAFSQKLDTVKFNNPLPILNGKAVFTFPAGALNVKRDVDIMSADHNANEETRIMYDLGDKRLVFFAEELFALGEDQLFEHVSKDYAGDPFKLKVLTDKNQLYSILATPTKWDSTQNGILLNTLIVKTPDNTLFRIHALITPTAYKWKDQYIQLTEQVFASLAKGTRSIDLSARKETLSIFGTDKKFTFDIPQNYVVNVSQKYDFQVFKFRTYRPYSDTNWTNITLYTGHHPSANYRDYGFSQADLQKKDGNFLGKKVSWLFFPIPKEGYYCKEQIIPADEIEEDLLVHISMTSNLEGSLDELTRMMESVTLTK